MQTQTHRISSGHVMWNISLEERNDETITLKRTFGFGLLGLFLHETNPGLLAIECFGIIDIELSSTKS